MSDITVFKRSATVASPTLKQGMGFYQGVITVMAKANIMAERDTDGNFITLSPFTK
jgi:hypothetical protein